MIGVVVAAIDVRAVAAVVLVATTGGAAPPLAGGGAPLVAKVRRLSDGFHECLRQNNERGAPAALAGTPVAWAGEEHEGAGAEAEAARAGCRPTPPTLGHLGEEGTFLQQ